MTKYGWIGIGFAAALYAVFSGTEGHDLLGALIAALAFCGAIIQRSSYHGILATAALCLGSNAYLLNLKWATGDVVSKCNINSVLNCDLINQSATSELFGIPITLFGAAYYLGLLFSGLSSEKTPKAFYTLCGMFSAFSLTYSIWLAYQSKLLGAFCVVCATIYIGNALLMWASVKGAREFESSVFADPMGALSSRGFKVLAGCFVVITVFGAVSQPPTVAEIIEQPDSQTNPVDFISGLYGLPHGALSLDGTEPVLGNKDAPYLIVEFADFGCPHCAVAEQELSELLKRNPDIQLRFKPYPLASQCNDVIKFDEAPERCRAAAAAECSGQQGKYFEMAHQLFANQGYFKDSDLQFMAKALSLDLPTFDQCMANPQTTEVLKQSAQAGTKAGIEGTPAMFLRGVFGDRFIEVPRGAAAVLRIIEAHKDGLELPFPDKIEGHAH